jgi:hypothetical protein
MNFEKILYFQRDLKSVIDNCQIPMFKSLIFELQIKTFQTMS